MNDVGTRAGLGWVLAMHLTGHTTGGSRLKVRNTMPHVLIVEDDRATLDVLVGVFEEEGWTAEGYTGTSAVPSRLLAHPSDVVITDVRLQGVDSGWTLIQLLRRDLLSLRDLPIIVISADRAQIASRRQWLEAQHIPVLEKPFSIDDLLELATNLAG
jgi:two-component system catabolic regulation response regulator CreB